MLDILRLIRFILHLPPSSSGGHLRHCFHLPLRLGWPMNSA